MANGKMWILYLKGMHVWYGINGGKMFPAEVSAKRISEQFTKKQKLMHRNNQPPM